MLLLLSACKSTPAAKPAPSPVMPPPVIEPLEQWTPDEVLILEFEAAYSTTELVIETGEGEFDYAVDWDDDGVWDEVGLKGPATHNISERRRYRDIEDRGQVSSRDVLPIQTRAHKVDRL